MNIKISKNVEFGYDKPPVIIAEISSNHGGSKEKFLKLIDQAYDNGADLVKIQTYEPEDITFNSDLKPFIIKNGLWKGKNLWNLYKKACTPYSWHEDAFKLAKKRNKILFSTPFSNRALIFLKSFSPKIFKISSFEITDLYLVKMIAKTRKPIILSTGVSTAKEINEAMKIIYKFHKKIILLHCVSSYPTSLSDANINRVNFLKKEFNKHLIGLSDHTRGLTSSLSATALGVVAIEKHVKLNNNSITEDSEFSIPLKDLRVLKEETKNIFISLGIGKINKKISDNDKKNLIYRRSIYAKKNLNKNDIITEKNIKTLRPSIGIPANKFFKIIGMRLKKNINADEPIYQKNLEK
jgi:pseudaminic acid synthase|tara:strand:+ start:15964 stop:17019 length:1056 start_codon:yes stop_codon:yes gene_type:complete